MPVAGQISFKSFLGRRYFKIPESSFTFLFFFDFTSYIARKNPFAVLQAFAELRKRCPNEDLCLVIKVKGGETREEDYRIFRDYIAKFEGGLVVIDNQGWIVDMSVAAANLLGVMPAQTEGKQAAEVFANWPSLAALLNTEQRTMQEICLEKDNHAHYYELHIIKLSDRGGSSMGKAFIWKEITAQKEAQEQLIKQEKALSILSERNRIGRDFHDGPAQLGSYLQMELQTILILLNKERLTDAKTHIKRLVKTARNFNVEVRETIADLKTGFSSSQDFLQLLKDYLDRYQENYGIKTELVQPSQQLDRLLEPMAALQLLRIIQEAANNVRKHAQANNVLVKIGVSDLKIVVMIADDGQGFDLSWQSMGQNHYGLTIMRERAEEVGGKVRFESQPGAGTKVIIEIPLGKAELHEDIVG
jgi:signal transduction histidine kinase